MSSNGGVEDYTEWIYSTVEVINDKIINTWDYFSSDSNNLNNLPHNLQLSLNEFMDKLSLNGSLPTLPQQWTSKLTLPPPPPPTSLAKQALNKLTFEIKNHPYLTGLLLTTTSLTTTYYFFPKTFNHHSSILLKPLRPFIPLMILPTSDRPKRLHASNSQANTSNSNTNEIRKEVALVLGAEGLGREIALDLEKRGFVVIATVKNASEVEILEKKSRGWMKALVLDPTESSSVSPFLRSLSTALSLRFPIHSSGDPFARPSHAISLTSVINCLSLPSSSNSEPLCPLEGMETEDVKKYLGERVATVIGVLKGILPIMRSMAGRPNAPEGVIVSLLPSNTANFSLPFQALSSASDSAILSILNSLRRELTASKTMNLRSTILEVGFFDLPSSSSSTTPLPNSPSLSASASLNLSPRLSSIYTSSLSLHSSPSSSPLSTRSPSPIKKLTQTIFNILVYSRGSSSSRIGAGSTTYWFIGNFIPLGMSDNILIFRDLLRKGLRRFSGSVPITATVGSSTTVVEESVGSPSTIRGSTSLPVPSTSTQNQNQAYGYGTSSQASLNSLASTSTTTSTGSTNNSFFNSSSPPTAASSSNSNNYTTLNPNRPSHPSQSQSQSHENPFLFEETLQHSTNILHGEGEQDQDVDSEEDTNSFGSNSGLGSFVGSEAGWRDDEEEHIERRAGGM